MLECFGKRCCPSPWWVEGSNNGLIHPPTNFVMSAFAEPQQASRNPEPKPPKEFKVAQMGSQVPKNLY
eukprot:4485477-Amphidinium_carterae.1